MDLFIFVGLFSTQLSLAKVGVAPCTKGNCPEGYICQEQICKKCLRCDLLFRKGNSCVTDFNNCKDCLEGYEEVLVTDFSNVKKPCKQIKKKVKLKICSDISCPVNNYCKEDSCVKCFECKLLNRLPPTDNCAKGLDECGTCMIGYYEISVTTEAKYKPCEKDASIKSNVLIETPVLAVAFCCALILVILVMYFKDKFSFESRASGKILNDRTPIYPSAPPFHTIDPPDFVRKTEGVQPSDFRFVEERKQQAKVYKKPSASYYFHNSGNEQVAPTDESNNAVMENNNETPPRSDTLSNSSQSEESCVYAMLPGRYSELDVEESGEDIVEPNENVTDESNLTLVSVSVTDGPSQPSENNDNNHSDEDDEERDLSETKNEEKTQKN